MNSTHTPGNSFSVALASLKCASVDAQGVRALKVCYAADDLLAALQALEKAIKNNEPFSRAEHEQARAAISKATAS